ncbi:hypothetical protein L204_103927 [Cryptococcus depauperatus]|nr:8-amino-7-oxononanoate synthase [Cryptococcus depauperatus CBS 7855]
MTELDIRLEAFLTGRKEKGRFRTLKEYDTSPKSGLVDFSSNDYLSLTTSPSLRTCFLERLANALAIFGSTGSRLLSGCSPSHSALENRFAALFNSPSALLFNSGWDANVSFFATVPQASDWVVYDELIHASVHSGLRSSRVPESRRVHFSHNSPQDLRNVLRRIMAEEPVSSRSTVFLAVESLYSMDGDMSPLPLLLDVLEEHVPRSQQCVVVDEAHSTGVYGDKGRGIVHALKEEGGWGEDGTRRRRGRVDVRLMTFGKAVGCSGAVLLCSPTVRSFLINFARPFIFSTAMPHTTLIALDCVWDLLQSQEGERRRESLMATAFYLHSLLKDLLAGIPSNLLRLPPNPIIPFESNNSPYLPSNPLSPIIGILTPNPHALSAFLLGKGFIVRPVVPPTVPPGAERVRVCIRADMDRDVIEGLVASIREWVELKTHVNLKAKL